MSSLGHGKGTVRKEEGFATQLRISARLSKRLPDRTYWHVDCNSGPGSCDLIGTDGSPLVFDRIMAEEDRPYNGFFCDVNLKFTSALLTRLHARRATRPPGSWISVETMDNTECLSVVASMIRQRENPAYAFGTVLCDPNAIKDGGLPLEALAKFHSEFPRMDSILHLNANVLRSGRGAKRKFERNPAHCRPCFKGFADWPELEEWIPRFGTRDWWVRNPLAVQGHAFITLVGRQRRRESRRPYQDFYPLDSREGLLIFKTLKPLPDAPGQTFLFDQENDPCPE
jgi:hypothetical protein